MKQNSIKTALKIVIVCLLIPSLGGCFSWKKDKKEELAQKPEHKSIKPGREISYGKTVDRVVARVNHQVIVLSEIQEKSLPLLREIREKYSGRDREKKIKETEKEQLDIYIEKTLQIQRAEQMGIFVPEKEIDNAVEDLKKKHGMTDENLLGLLKEEGLTLDEYKNRLREQILISKVVGAEVGSKVVITDEEKNEYYNEHKNSFLKQKEVELRQIFFSRPRSENTSIKEKEAKAVEALEKIRQGADFIEMAKTYSEGPAAKNGGYLGSFKKGEIVQEIEQVAFQLKEGEVSDIIKTDQGLHIIKVEKNLEKIAKSFEEIEKDLENILFRQRMEEGFNDWIEELRQRSVVETFL